MSLAQGPQRSDASEARNPRSLGLESSALALSHRPPCTMTIAKGHTGRVVVLE